MTTPEHKNQMVLQGLIEHFTHSGEQQTPEQIADSTGLPLEAVEDALRALWTTHRIEGIDTAEAGFPGQVTGVPDV